MLFTNQNLKQPAIVQQDVSIKIQFKNVTKDRTANKEFGSQIRLLLLLYKISDFYLMAIKWFIMSNIQ